MPASSQVAGLTAFQVPARQPLELLDILPNWSPTVDFVTTDEFSTWNQAVGAGGTKMQPWKERTIRKPDRIFATSGHEKKGSITEYRYGLKAGIGLDLDYGSELREAWVFPSNHVHGAAGFHLVLSMPDSSAVLQLSEDFSQAQEPASAISKYDLSSSTLAVAHSERLVIQITRASIVLIRPDRRYDLVILSYYNRLACPRNPKGKGGVGRGKPSYLPSYSFLSVRPRGL